MPTLARARWLDAALPVVSALALAALFQGGLLFEGPLRQLDWDVHYHYYDWIHIGLVRHGTLPLFMADAWHTPNFVANAQSPVLGPLVGLLGLLETDTYIKLLIWLYTSVGLLGGYWLARDLGARAPVAAVTSVTWAMSGFFAAHLSVGHHWSLGAYLVPLLLFAFRRAIDGSPGALVGAAAVNALAALEGQHHPFLWQNGILVTWAALECLRIRSPRPLVCLGQVLALTLGLGAVRLIPVFSEFADYAPQWRIGGLPPSALAFSLLSADQGRETAGFGVVFQHDSGWWEYTFYLGAAGLAFALVGAAAGARRSWPLLAIAAVLGLASLDTRALGFDAWDWLQHLPAVNSQRGPSRLLGVALFPLIFAAAPGWQRILDACAERWPGVGRRAAHAAMCVLGLWITVDLVGAARDWQAGSVGAPQESRAHRLAPPQLLRTPGTVTALAIEPNRLHYRVEAERTGILLFHLVFAQQRGQWSADPLPVIAGPNGALAVGVPAGSHDVVLRYRPRGLVAGAGISLATGIGALVWWRRRRTRARPSSGADAGAAAGSAGAAD
ncbi:MAG: hypothetical protein ACQGVK_00050 [Myxococcota bacterium]